MTIGGDRLDRIENILKETAKLQREMAARQQYHDEAFERHDAAMKEHDAAILEHKAAIRLHDAEMKDIRDAIGALVRVAGVQNQRLDRLEGGQPS